MIDSTTYLVDSRFSRAFIRQSLLLYGIIIRETRADEACSGDYYEGEDEPKPYLWE